MKKNSLSTTGLSLSQAQSISNLCNQRAKEIENLFSKVNNYSKKIKNNDDVLFLQNPVPMPNNVVDLLIEKAALYACQAFLMENIQAKEKLLNKIKNEVVDTKSVEIPEFPTLFQISENKKPFVNEEWGWEQLTESEINEYTDAEAYASHLGQFIHKGSILAKLREELNNIPDIEWIEIKKDEKTPVFIEKHHTSQDLLTLHENIAGIHREFEQKVNYYKSKVKNLVTLENARIAKENSDLQSEYEKMNKQLMDEYRQKGAIASERIKTIQNEFEIQRHEKIKEVAAMRINVDPRFQEVINFFLARINNTKNENAE